MLWLKAFHIISVVVWFAGLLYLIRLYVYHASEQEAIVIRRFEGMEHRLYYYITVPGAFLTVLTGGGLLALTWDLFRGQAWIHIKMVLVLFLLVIHLYSGHLRKRFLQGNMAFSPIFFRRGGFVNNR